MKIAIIADTHIGIRNDSVVFHEYFKRSIDDFFQYLQENDIKNVIHLGDLFDRRKYVNFASLNLCRKEFLDRLEENKIQTNIICGNHDVYFKNTNEINSLDEVIGDKYENIRCHTSATEYIVGGTKILLVPWICDENRERTLQAIKDTTSDICMGHLEISGFEMFRGSVCNHGDDKDTFKKFDLVLSGHFHHPSKSGNIHYVGAFGEYTWSDYNDPRGFTVFDTKTRQMEFVQNKHNIFKVLKYDDKEEPDIEKKLLEIQYSDYKDAYVKVICSSRTNMPAFDMLMDNLYKVNPIDISIVDDTLNYSIGEESDDCSIDNVQDTVSILNNYISGLTTTVDSDKLKKFMHDVYTEAVSVQHTE